MSCASVWTSFVFCLFGGGRSRKCHSEMTDCWSRACCPASSQQLALTKLSVLFFAIRKNMILRFRQSTCDFLALALIGVNCRSCYSGQVSRMSLFAVTYNCCIYTSFSLTTPPSNHNAVHSIIRCLHDTIEICASKTLPAIFERFFFLPNSGSPSFWW